MKVLEVEGSETVLEVSQIVRAEKRKHGLYLHTEDGNIYDFNEFINEPKSACVGDYVFVEYDGDVACEKELQFDGLIETLNEVQIPYTYA